MSRDVREIRTAAEELLSDYVHCLDEDRLEEWPEFFTETASYRIVPRDNVERNLPIATMSCNSQGMMRDRVVAIRKASVFSPRYLRHIVGSVRVLGQEGEHHLLQASYAVFQTLQDGETKVFNVGEYRTRMVFRDGRPKFQEVSVIYDSLQIPGLLVIPI